MADLENSGNPMDMDMALSHVDGDARFLAELAEVFLQDYPRLMEELRRSILHGNYPELQRAAHTLKGRLAFFGINKVRDQAFALEMMGRERNSENAAQTLAELESAMKSALAEFAALIQTHGQ